MTTRNQDSRHAVKYFKPKISDTTWHYLARQQQNQNWKLNGSTKLDEVFSIPLQLSSGSAGCPVVQDVQPGARVCEISFQQWLCLARCFACGQHHSTGQLTIFFTLNLCKVTLSLLRRPWFRQGPKSNPHPTPTDVPPPPGRVPLVVMHGDGCSEAFGAKSPVDFCCRGGGVSFVQQAKICWPLLQGGGWVSSSTERPSTSPEHFSEHHAVTCRRTFHLNENCRSWFVTLTHRLLRTAHFLWQSIAFLPVATDIWRQHSQPQFPYIPNTLIKFKVIQTCERYFPASQDK